MAYLHVGFSYLKEMKILTLTPFTTFVLALVSPPILGCIIIWYMHPAAEKVYHLGFKPENSLSILILRLPFIRKPLKWNSMLYSSLCRCQFLCSVLKYFVLCYYDVDYRSQALCGPFGEGERFLLCKITGYRNTLSNSRIGKSSCKDFWTSYFDHITFLFFFFFLEWFVSCFSLCLDPQGPKELKFEVLRKFMDYKFCNVLKQYIWCFLGLWAIINHVLFTS